MKKTESVKELISRLLKFDFPCPVEEVKHEGVYVSYDGTKAVVGGEDTPALARAYTLLAKGLSENKTSLSIQQSRSFDVCGAMLDMSFGSVTKPEAVMRYLDYMAAFGLNMLMLYTEDTYEVEGYPYFGYQRGRYTVEELRAIDDYADQLGIEVIPCIQTFGHLKNFLRYSAHAKIAENKFVLLPGEEETYRFIRACIETCRKAFRSNRIHIGCDETAGVGFGKTLKRDGYRDPFLIYNEHVSRVVEICREFNYRPMMWSDMYTTLANSQKRAGDGNELPAFVLESMPDADMVFWNYYHTDREFYRERLIIHQKYNRKTLFAGGIWAWNGHVPNFGYTYDTVHPALEECFDFGVREVFGAAWAYGDINHLQALPCLAVYSEHCWLGRDCTREDVDAIAEFVCGMSREYCDAVDAYYCGMIGDFNIGKLVFWSDPILNLLCYDYDLPAYEAIWTEALKKLEQMKDVPYGEYYRLLFLCLVQKVRLQISLREKYKAGDRAALKEYAEVILPEMEQNYRTLYEMHDDLWHRDHKTHGFEKLSNHYGSAIERLGYTRKMLKKYLSGEIDTIEAMDGELYQGTKQRFLPAKTVMNSYLD